MTVFDSVFALLVLLAVMSLALTVGAFLADVVWPWLERSMSRRKDG